MILNNSEPLEIYDLKYFVEKVLDLNIRERTDILNSLLNLKAKVNYLDANKNIIISAL